MLRRWHSLPPPSFHSPALVQCPCCVKGPPLDCSEFSHGPKSHMGTGAVARAGIMANQCFVWMQTISHFFLLVAGEYVSLAILKVSLLQICREQISVEKEVRKKKALEHLGGSVVERLPSAQGVIPGSWDQVAHPAPFRESASPLCLCLHLSLCVSRE